MFDTSHKGAVSALAAAVVLLERREAKARAAYDEVMRRFNADESAQAAWIVDEIDELGLERLTARSRWMEAQSALATVRELVHTM